MLLELDLPYEGVEVAFRRMKFFVMGRNCDDYTKNFSFRLRQGHRWELAPAYDFTFAHNLTGAWTYQHRISVNGKLKDITRDDLLAQAAQFDVRMARDLLEQVRRAVQDWPAHADAARVSAVEVQRIRSQLIVL